MRGYGEEEGKRDPASRPCFFPTAGASGGNQADGTIRSDADARDVILLIGYLSRVDEAELDPRARHPLNIILDGLRAREQATRESGNPHKEARSQRNC